MNDLKKEIKLRSRISKYHKKKEESSKFVEEDVESPEFKKTADSVAELH